MSVDRAGLDALLRPERIALVGASDSNIFSRRAFAQHQRIGAGRPLALVNPRSPVVHGVATVPSCSDIEGGVDCVYLTTSQAVTPDALRDAAAAGARAAVVVSSGWAEEGPEGAAAQAELVALARGLGVTLTGPNHLGFANLRHGVALTALGLELPVEPGHLALVTQSGAVGSSMMGYAARQDVRFSVVVTTGNEAMVTVEDVLAYLVEDDDTRAVAVFAETFRQPQLFRAAAHRAAELGKAVVVLKAGSSELAARTAQAHTGALVGDDRVVDAVFRQDGVIRVRTVEDLLCTGALAASTGRWRAPGVAVISASGGACDLVADRGAEAGLELPALSEGTVAELAQILPRYAHPQNPLDMTGGTVSDADAWRRAAEIMAAEPGVGLVAVSTSLPTPGQTQRDDLFHALGKAATTTGLPVVVFPQIDQPQSDYLREVRAASGIDDVLPGLDRFVVAAAAVGRWTTWSADRRVAEPAAERAPQVEVPLRPSEWESRTLLTDAGIPVVPAELVADADGAVRAAERFGGAVVLKMCSRQVAHKTELGGVELEVAGDDAVRAAHARLVERAVAAGVELDGVLVSPMRRGGLELLVGVTRDDDWGQVLAVALGGAFVELLDDSALRVLPVTPTDIRAMLGELRGAAVLDGFRGGAPADRDRLVDVIGAVADLAVRLGPDVTALEVNPLLVDGSRVEALDVLLTQG